MFKTFSKLLFGLLILTVLIASLHANQKSADSSYAESVTIEYMQIAKNRYEASYQEAKNLQNAVIIFLEDSNKTTHQAAKDAWLQAHNVYSLTEVFRFGNPNVDAWEGAVNSWPVDEGFIDYVSENYQYDEGNVHARANIVANYKNIIDDEFLTSARDSDLVKGYEELATISDSEANVVTGFHAIEFLLWGQDHNQTPTSSGQRPYTDYLQNEECTNGHCEQRAEYLNQSARLLVRDLRFMVHDWQTSEKYHRYANDFVKLSNQERLNRILIGMGTLSYGELAGERMRVALLANDQEDEQSCFSDKTHWAIYQNALAVQTLYIGNENSGTEMAPNHASLSSLVAKVDPELDKQLKAQMVITMQYAQDLLETGEGSEPFDQMILANNKEGNLRVNNLIQALKAQAETIEKIQAIVPELASL